MSAELRRNPLQKPAETENTKKKMKTTKNQRGGKLGDLPDCLHDFIENLGVAENAIAWTSRHFLPFLLMNYQWSREQKLHRARRKHSVYTHFPKDRNCDICLRTKIKTSSCRRRTGTVVLNAENFVDWKTADHKVLSEESESRNNHRYAVEVQDLATQWLQSYPCKTKTSQETQKSFMNFLEPTRKPKSFMLTVP